MCHLQTLRSPTRLGASFSMVGENVGNHMSTCLRHSGLLEMSRWWQTSNIGASFLPTYTQVSHPSVENGCHSCLPCLHWHNTTTVMEGQHDVLPIGGKIGLCRGSSDRGLENSISLSLGREGGFLVLSAQSKLILWVFTNTNR